MTERVYPVLVDGTSIAHLAWPVLDTSGTDWRAICPAGALITRPLRLIRVGELFVWCGACQSWAAAAGVGLPEPVEDATGQLGGASAAPPAAD